MPVRSAPLAVIVFFAACAFPPKNWTDREVTRFDIEGSLRMLAPLTGTCATEAQLHVRLFDITQLLLSPKNPTAIGECEVDLATSSFACQQTALSRIGYVMVALLDDREGAPDCIAPTQSVILDCSFNDLKNANKSECGASNWLTDQVLRADELHEAYAIPSELVQTWQNEWPADDSFASLQETGGTVTLVTRNGAPFAGALPYLPSPCRDGSHRCRASVLGTRDDHLGLVGEPLTTDLGLWLGQEYAPGLDGTPVTIPFDTSADADKPNTYGAVDCSGSALCFASTPVSPHLAGEIAGTSAGAFYVNIIGDAPPGDGGVCRLRQNLIAANDESALVCP